MFVISQNLVDHIKKFEEEPYALSELLSERIGDIISWKDASWIYVESVVKRCEWTFGSEMGIVMFVDEIKHSKRHLQWFALMAFDKESFDLLCQTFERLSSQSHFHLYKYFTSIPQDDPESANPFLKAQFQQPLAASKVDELNTFRYVEPCSNLVYYWSPPRSFCDNKVV